MRQLSNDERHPLSKVKVYRNVDYTLFIKINKDATHKARANANIDLLPRVLREGLAATRAAVLH